MPVIFRYPLPTTPSTVDIEMPIGAEILAVQIMSGMPQMWAIVDPNAVVEIRKFAVIATGVSFDNSNGNIYAGSHVGTVQTLQGVLHVFDVTALPASAPPVILDPTPPWSPY